MTPELKEKLLRYANEKEPFTAHNHIRVCDIDEGSSRLELDLTEQSLNRWGQPHGGVLFTLADDACGHHRHWLRGLHPRAVRPLRRAPAGRGGEGRHAGDLRHRQRRH